MTRETTQPSPGDVLLGCAHALSSETHHVFFLPEEIGFRRPDGSAAKAKWIILCPICFVAHPDPTKAKIACDFTWDEGEPIRYKEPS